MLIYEGNLHKKIGAISQLGAEKITFPLKPDGHTDIQTDISIYRVASLLKILVLQKGQIFKILSKVYLCN